MRQVIPIGVSRRLGCKGCGLFQDPVSDDALRQRESSPVWQFYIGREKKEKHPPVRKLASDFLLDGICEASEEPVPFDLSVEWLNKGVLESIPSVAERDEKFDRAPTLRALMLRNRKIPPLVSSPLLK